MSIDTHAHMADQVFAQDLGEVLHRAAERGVLTIITVAENLLEARRCLELSSEHDILKPAAGLYPSVADPAEGDAVIAFIRRHRDELIGIGEVGLDYWIAKEEPERETQRFLFKRFIDLSRELDLPLNVHSRSAGRHVIELLLRRGARRVQLHAFDGRAATARPAVEAGFFFSIPPSIVYSQQKKKLVRALPLSCLLCETDSPVLGPDPDIRNEPFNILTSIRAVAQIRELPEEKVREAFLRNAIRLYGDRLVSNR